MTPVDCGKCGATVLVADDEYWDHTLCERIIHAPWCPYAAPVRPVRTEAKS